MGGTTVELRYWDSAENASRQVIADIQLRKLKHTVQRAYDSVPYYRQVFDQHGLKPGHIRTLADVRLIPFFEKTMLRQLQPYGVLAVPPAQVSRVHATSGTTGRPCMVAFTARDIELVAELGARHLSCCGLGAGDLLYQGYGYGMWIGGWAFEQAARRVGMAVFPAGPGRSVMAMEMLRDYGMNAITCTPSFASYLLEQAYERGVNPQAEWRLRAGMLGGETASKAIRKRLQEGMPAGFMPYNVYGTTELGGPFVGVSCPYGAEDGTLHIWSDHYLVEVVDPDTGDPAEFGQPGELVVTTLDREAAPMLRWRTRDLTAWPENPFDCPCGRGGHVRVASVTGRSDDMIKLRGAMVFPSQVEEIVSNTPGTGPGWLLVVDKDRALAQATLHVEVPAPDESAGAAVRDLLISRLREVLGVRIPVELAALASLPRYEGKARRVLSPAEFVALAGGS